VSGRWENRLARIGGTCWNVFRVARKCRSRAEAEKLPVQINRAVMAKVRNANARFMSFPWARVIGCGGWWGGLRVQVKPRLNGVSDPVEGRPGHRKWPSVACPRSLFSSGQHSWLTGTY